MKAKKTNPKSIWMALFVSVSIIALWVPLFGGESIPLGSIYTQANNNADNSSYTIPAAYVDGQIVLSLTTPDSMLAEEICTQYNLEINQYLPQLGLFLLQSAFPDIRDLAEEIASYPGVESAYPNYEVTPLQSVQGSHAIPDEISLTDYINQPSAASLALAEVHQISTGNQVIVGLIDGGVDYNHPAFEGKVRTGYDYVDNDTDAFDEPGGRNSGHGTFVAGVIHLMAPDADIYSYRVSDISGRSDGYLVAEAILQAIQDGCDVINISLVTSAQHSAVAQAIEFAKYYNILVVAAAGNYAHERELYPACDPYVISVGAIAQDNTVADFSNDADYVDIFAPGIEIYGPYPENEYAIWSGTSFSTPFVTGLAALLYSDVSSIAREWVVEAIISSADNMGTGYLTPPTRNLMIINPLAAVQMEEPMFVTIFDIHNQGKVMQAELGWEPWSITAMGFVIEGDDLIFGLPYTIEICQSAKFIQSWWGSEMITCDLLFNIDIAGLPVGIYQDTVYLYVEGAYNSPAMQIYTLQIKEEIAGPISGFLYDPVLWGPYKIFEGGQGPTNNYLKVSAAKLIDQNYIPVEGLQYDLYLDQNPEFVELTGYLPPNVPPSFLDGLTEDHVYYNVNGSNLPPGVYYDTIFAEIDGVTISPIHEIIELQVMPPDTMWLEAAGTLPENCEIADDGLSHYYLMFGDINVGSTRVDTVNISLNYNGPSTEYNLDIHCKDYFEDKDLLDVLYDMYDFIDVDGFAPNELPMTGYTNDTIRVIIDWSNFGYDEGDVGSSYVRWFKVEVPGSSNEWMVLDLLFNVAGSAPTATLPEDDSKIITNLGNYPNPFNPATEFRFSLSQETNVNLTVFNILGRNVITLVDRRLPAGAHAIRWDGKNSTGSKVSTGMYFYRITAGDYIETKKMVMLK